MFVSDTLVVIVRWVKISLKYAGGQEDVMQLGDVIRGVGRHADRQKVIVVNLRYFSA